MCNAERVNDTTWDCKYHLIWIPKYRREVLYGNLRKYLGKVFRDLSLQKESRVMAGHLMPDHVHMLLSIPPKYSVTQVVGYIKGKSAIHIAQTFSGHKKTSPANTFGQEAIMYPQPVKTRRPFAIT
jgi:putative transposase